ncbi:THAP domain-containing protein 5-like isoform X2 [Wyeomyia smithii]|uniref:THAP domain-containing protein 5-like isoform X2 n=1 Tax=Wyeomyia smithii TaxID=174621 RepID=UPI0024680FEE|nr:THAP domain-containing protein 5-like isoform X2 [Wyeomyia smithii]
MRVAWNFSFSKGSMIGFEPRTWDTTATCALDKHVLLLRMPYFCAVSGCHNKVSRNPKIAYHYFPRNPEQLKHWIKFCGWGESWVPQRNQGICAVHFTDDDYDDRYQKRHELIGAKMRRNLKANALPSIGRSSTIDEVHFETVDVDEIPEKMARGAIYDVPFTPTKDPLGRTTAKKSMKSDEAPNSFSKWRHKNSMYVVNPFSKNADSYSIEEPKLSAVEDTREVFCVTDKQKSLNTEDVGNAKDYFQVTPRYQKVSKNLLFRNIKRKYPEPKLSECISKSNQQGSTESNHPIDTFFQGLAATVKTFSTKYQLIAKNRMFNVISELEWEQMPQKSSDSRPPTQNELSDIQHVLNSLNHDHNFSQRC